MVSDHPKPAATASSASRRRQHRIAAISNVFAILGLRSLYFALADMVDKFRYLKVALALVRMVVGTKMLLAEWLQLTLGAHFNLYLLTVVLAILAGGIVASIAADRRDMARH